MMGRSPAKTRRYRDRLASADSGSLDTETYRQNVLAFMDAAYRFTGLGDQTYREMVAEQVDSTLLWGLYPFDAVVIVRRWQQYQQKWLWRYNRWDLFVHRRAITDYVNAVVELQRYMPSLYTRAMSKFEGDNEAFLSMLNDMDGRLTSLFVIDEHKLLNFHVNDLLTDIFSAAMFVATGRPLDSVVPRQVKRGSKNGTNEGFEWALANFFVALGRLVKIRAAR